MQKCIFFHFHFHFHNEPVRKSKVCLQSTQTHKYRKYLKLKTTKWLKYFQMETMQIAKPIYIYINALQKVSISKVNTRISYAMHSQLFGMHLKTDRILIQYQASTLQELNFSFILRNSQRFTLFSNYSNENGENDRLNRKI